MWDEILRSTRELRELVPVLGPRVPAHVAKEGDTRIDWCVIEKND